MRIRGSGSGGGVVVDIRGVGGNAKEKNLQILDFQRLTSLQGGEGHLNSEHYNV